MKGIVSAISFLLPARRYPSTQRAITSGGSVLREEHHGDMIRSIIPEELDLTVGSSDFRMRTLSFVPSLRVTVNVLLLTAAKRISFFRVLRIPAEISVTSPP